jgi:hypothetical protein
MNWDDFFPLALIVVMALTVAICGLAIPAQWYTAP